MAIGIGETLRGARLRQGVSLGDVADGTRVRESHLSALEQEEFGTLGSHVYVKGFLRSYAQYLGLDPEPLVERYRDAFEPDEHPVPEPHLGAAQDRRYARLVLAAMGAILVLALLWAGFGGDEADAPQGLGAQVPAAGAPAS